MYRPYPSRQPTDTIPNADHTQLDPDQLTPMMRQYVAMKERYVSEILLFRVGDFFECFFGDAVTVSRELELVLTSKEGGKAIGRVPMTGVPHHALDRYSSQLVEKGYAVAVCDQLEEASAAHAEKRMVDRGITRVITPGTVIEAGMLQATRNNFLAAVVLAKQNWGLAYADISTGEFATTQASGLDRLQQELMRLQPSEILLPTTAPDVGGLIRPGEKTEAIPTELPEQFCYALRRPTTFELAEAKNRIMQRFTLKSLEGIGCDRLPLAVRAAGGLLAYLEETLEQDVNDRRLGAAKERSIPLQIPKTYTMTDYLTLDYQTRRNLEITETVRDGVRHGSLLWALDKTRTAMGARTLQRWLLQPLLDAQGIQARHATITELTKNLTLREDIQKLLRSIYDLERLTGRAGSGTASPRDLMAIADSIATLPDLAALAATGTSPYLKALQSVPPELEAIGQKLHAHLVESPPIHIKDGSIIRPGISPELDARRAELVADRDWIAKLEVTERDRTGVTTLKVGFNKTFGYYLSLPRSKSDQAPDDYIRKQTLANEERYITPDLKEREARILTAQEDLNRIEYEVFLALRSEVGALAEAIRQVARAVAAIDVLCGWAELTVEQGYCCPAIDDTRELTIVEGRHPVVEQLLPPGFFVPNAAYLGRTDTNDRPDAVVLTGPNASGKSCYLRQVGLIQLMAQTGCFVPARSASLGICDRIFTRVGAVDDLATGQSTFMVEMNETANILNHATPRSLVLLDEIGRGTATFDGLSIAWSVAEYLADTLKARTIFATHYHEMNELASILDNVANYQVTVKELPDEIIFLRQVTPGGADRSYGIEVGRLAGLPPVVIDRARQVMQQIEKHSKIAIGLRKSGAVAQEHVPDIADAIEQLDMF